MVKLLAVRAMSSEEAEAIHRLAHSRTEPARAVERARLIKLSSEGKGVAAIAEKVGLCRAAVRLWIKRFNERGMAGLEDEPRSGRPPRYSAEQVGQVIATSLREPRELGLPFASWTLDRLAAYLKEEKGIAMKRSRIDEILLAEGLGWRSQETWFSERVDREFGAKRGPSSPSTATRPRAV
jgi:transposase